MGYGRGVGIVGGGPSGLVLAAALAQRDVPTTVFERDTDPDLAPRYNPNRSYTIDLTGHALRALRHIGAERWCDERMLPFRGLKYFGQISPWNLPGWTGSRGDILRALHGVIRDRHAGKVRFELEACVDALDIASGSVTWSRGSTSHTEAFELVVGADGAGSLVREALEQQAPGFTVSRRSDPNFCTMLELDRVGDRLDPHYLHGLSLRPFCVAGAIRGDSGPDTYRWFCAVGTKREQRFAGLDQARSYLRKRVPVLLEYSSERALGEYASRPCYDIGRSVSCSRLGSQRAVLLGDAAAAFPPIGQGANAAMESALEFDLAIGAAPSSGDGLRAAAAQYAASWKGEIDALAWLARQGLFENRLQILRLQLTRAIWANPFELAKSDTMPFSEVARRTRRLWPLWR